MYNDHINPNHEELPLFECVYKLEACCEFVKENHCAFRGNLFQLLQIVTRHVRVVHGRLSSY